MAPTVITCGIAPHPIRNIMSLCMAEAVPDGKLYPVTTAWVTYRDRAAGAPEASGGTPRPARPVPGSRPDARTDARVHRFEPSPMHTVTCNAHPATIRRSRRPLRRPDRHVGRPRSPSAPSHCLVRLSWIIAIIHEICCPATSSPTSRSLDSTETSLDDAADSPAGCPGAGRFRAIRSAIGIL